MKGFVKRLGVFFIVLIGIVSVYVVFLNYRNTQLLKNYKTADDINTLFAGDSHMEAAINDSLYPHSLSIAQSGEGYVYTYAKLEPILTSNANIKTVVLGYSYHNISEYFDYAIYGKNSIPSFSNFFFVLPLSQKSEIMGKNKSLVYKAFRSIFTKGTRNISASKNNYSFIGGYKPTVTEKVLNSESIKRRIDAQYYCETPSTGFSEMNIDYLNRIIDLCKEKNVKLYLLNAPLHKEYRDKTPANFITKFNGVIANKNCDMIELSTMEIPDSCFLPDGDHVRYSGAKLVTAAVLETIQKDVNN